MRHSTPEPIYLPVRRQIQLFKTRKLSPLEVLNAQIEQIENFGDRINAITYDHFRSAKSAARKSEARYRAGKPLPLDGVTVAIKDEFDRAGWRTTRGSYLCSSRPKTADHPLIGQLLAAGAVLHIQTTSPEFQLLPVTWSDRWGVTRNPWNTAITPGGSSGGSAAVTAAGMTTLGIGSDMGGSVRIPAALCGLYGFNPPYGRNASAAQDALLVHASSGPLARTLDDMILLQNVMAESAGSGVSVKPKLELPRRFPPIKNWKIALSMDQGWAIVEDGVRANILKAMRVLEDAGAVVEEVKLDFGMTGRELRGAIEKALFSTAAGGELAALPARKMTTYGKRFRRLALHMTAKQASQASEASIRAHSTIQDKVFGRGYQVLICPTVCTTSVKAEYDPTRDRLEIAGNRIDPFLGWFQTSIFNLLNWMPVINVPSGRADNGVPVGFQIAAKPYDDLSAFAVAASYDSRSPQLFRGTAIPKLAGDLD